MIDVDPSAVVTRRLTDTRRRALAQDRGDLGAVQTIHVGAPHEQKDTVAAAARAVRATTSSRCGARSSSGSATTCARTASRRSSSASPAGSTRRSSPRSPSRRSARARALRLDAVALLVGGDARRRAAARREPRHRLPRDRDRAGRRGSSSARSRRRSRAASPISTEENLQARVRGTLLMALSNKFGWLARRDREQVGDVGRLRDALRRHGRRVRAAEGRVQDGRVPARAASERARRARADPASRRSSARRAPSCATTSATRTRCRRTRSSTACSRRTSRTTGRSRSWRGRLRPRRRRARRRADRPRRVQAPPGAARRAAAAEGVRPRPAHADHEPLAELKLQPGFSQVAVFEPLR